MSPTNDWRAVIGLEVHAQLKTRSKLFTPCPVAGGSTADLSPNTFTDEVVLALPGTLPVPNAEAIRLAVRLGLALGCTIDRRSTFSRKHYFYPDLPKGYQISQYEDPICAGGEVPVSVGGTLRRFALRRIHLEEDAGKTIHDARRNESRVDLNRAGVPLLEIVSEPVLGSAEEAIAYLKALHRLVVWLGVSDGDMEAGNFRCDANVSVHRPGTPLGTRTEIKNVNSFRFVGLAIDAEIARQTEVLAGGGEVVQETRGWDEGSGQTRSLRGKEDAHDYRYFPDPDLLVLEVSEELYEDEKSALPELPHVRETRLSETLGLGAYDAEVLTQSRARADYYEAALAAAGPEVGAKTVANWVINDLLGALGRSGLDLAESPVAPEALAALLGYLQSQKLSTRMAKDALAAMLEGADLEGWVAERGGQVSDAAALAEVIEPILERSAPQVAQFLGGKEKVLGYFVGQAMKALKGRANPEELKKVLRERLEARRQK